MPASNIPQGRQALLGLRAYRAKVTDGTVTPADDRQALVLLTRVASATIRELWVSDVLDEVEEP